MKTIISPVAIGALLAAILPMTCASARNSHDSDEPAAYSLVVNPSLPKSVKFADQKFDLNDLRVYERLDRELSAMTYTHGTTLLTIKRANRYMPMLAPILKQYDIPEDLLYLAAIESNFNPIALSGAKAAGLWQFMPGTAKEYGLEVNDYVDERYDPIKETEAACKYLRNAYSKYGKWESVAASYNAGMGRISRELTNQSEESAIDLWLPQETMRYPFRLLAMKIILEHPKEFGYRLREDQLYQPFDTRTVEVNTPVDSWADWAKAQGTNLLTLRTLNPWIRNTSLPNKSGKTYKVLLPADKDSFDRSKQKLRTYNKNWVM